MGHVIEHIALETQSLAGMETGYGRTRETKTPGVYNVVFSYVEEKVGIFAAESAVNIAQALVNNEVYDLQADLKKMREIREDVRLGPSTGSIVDEAVARDIPWIRLGTNSLVQLGYGVNQMRFQATITCKTSSIAVDIACNKEQTKQMLDAASIPVAKGGWRRASRFVRPFSSHRGWRTGQRNCRCCTAFQTACSGFRGCRRG